MFNSMMGLAEERLNEKRQATSRKGCMRGKGGPENATCMYKGVRQRTWGKWVAEIREANNGARLWLGTFDTSYEAAMAYDAAARKLHGPYAKLNLPQLAATARFPPSSGSFSIKYPENQGLFVNYYLSGVNIATETEAETLLYENMLCENMLCENMLCENMLCENNSDLPMNEKPEEMIKIDFSENLHVDLPDFDDSLMWKEATETMDYQALVDPGIFGCDFDDDNFWNQIKFPWE